MAIEFTSKIDKTIDIGYLADYKDAIPILAQWFYSEWSYLYPERTIQDFERLITERTNRDCIPLALVAVSGKEVLGTVCLKIHDMDTRTELTPWLAGLYVIKECQRHGIGSRLVSAIEQKARKLNVGKLYLYTIESESFYLRLNWHIIEKTEYHDCPVTIMAKDLSFN